VRPNGLDVRTAFFGISGANFLTIIENVGEIITLARTSSYIVTRLKLPASHGLILMTVSCGDGKAALEEQYIINCQGNRGI